MPSDPINDILMFSGTTGRSARNNNPLNLEYRPGTYQDKYGAELEPQPKKGKARFAKFPSMLAGYQAGLDQIAYDQSQGHTLSSFVHKFAPSHENPTEQLIQQYSGHLGISPDTPLDQIPADKLIVPMLARESSTKVIKYNKPIEPGAIEKILGGGGTQVGPAPEPPSLIERSLDLITPKAAEAAELPVRAEGAGAAVMPREFLAPGSIEAILGQSNQAPTVQLNQPKQGSLEDILGDSIPQVLPIGKEEVSDPEGRTWGELGMDLGLLFASAIPAGRVANLLLKGAKLSPAIMAGIKGALTGGIYGTVKEVGEALEVPIGGKHEGLIAESGPGKILEDAALFGTLDAAAGPVWRGLKKGLGSVNKMTGNVGEKAWDVVTVGVKKIPGVEKVIEKLQPPMERIREKLPQQAGTFRQARTMQSLSKEAGIDLTNEAKGLNFTERNELIGALSGGEIKSPKVQEIFDRFEKKLINSTSGKYQEEFVKNINKLTSKRMSAIAEADIPILGEHLEALDSMLTGKKPLKEMRQRLTKFIEDPTVSNEFKAYARDLYDLHATLPGDIAKTSNKATEAHILSKLIASPGVVSSVEKPSYVVSKHPSLKGMFIHKDIELELQGARELEKVANAWYQKWFLSPWKTNKVVLRPAAHVRNLFGNMILNDWGGLPFYRWDIYGSALREMIKGGKNIDQLRKIMGASSTFTKEELSQLAPALKYGASLPEKILNLFDHIAAPARNIYGAEETWFKLAKFIHNKQLGMAPTEAAIDAAKWTFNYSEITPLIRKVRSSPFGVPFITFQSKVLPLMAETAVKHPLRFSKWIGMGSLMGSYALDKLGMTEDEWSSLKEEFPDYMKGGWFLPMPYRDDKGQLKLLNLQWMIPGLGDVNEIMQRGMDNPWAPFLQSPLVNTLGTLATKKKTTGVPLYYDWEESGTKAAKTFNFLWQMWSPAVAPGNIDWNAMWDAIQERPEALSPEEAVLANLGFRLTSVDPAIMMKRRAALQKIHEAEATMQMRSELRRSASESESQEIIDRWVRGVGSIRSGD